VRHAAREAGRRIGWRWSRAFVPRRGACAVAFLVLILASLPGESIRAQAGWSPRLQLDNDYYNFWQRHTRRPDEEYTNGVKATLVSYGGSWWGSRAARHLPDCLDAARDARACRSTTVTFGQELYTPELSHAPHAVPDWELERPYHAWLYATGAAALLSERIRREVTLSLGVTGPPAGGEMAQALAHEIGFADAARGWETQVGFEPGIVLGYRHAILAARLGGDRGIAVDVAPEVAASIGNVRTHAELGATARIGWNLSHPWSPAAWRHRALFEWWLSAGGRVEHVARDMSLDGTLFSPRRRVERIPGVRQYEFGAGLRAGHLFLEYRAATRSREYRTGPLHHTWGSMTAGVSIR
jgi:hypothetical protein